MSDGETAGVGLRAADGHEPLVGLIHHGGQPVALHAQRGPQAV